MAELRSLTKELDQTIEPTEVVAPMAHPRRLESTEEADARSHSKKEIGDVNATKPKGSESSKTPGESHSKKGSESSKTPGKSHSKKDVDDVKATKPKASSTTLGKSHSKRDINDVNATKPKGSSKTLGKQELLISTGPDCPGGFSNIGTEKACNEARKKLGLNTWAGKSAPGAPERMSGCWIGEKGDVYFNPKAGDFGDEWTLAKGVICLEATAGEEGGKETEEEKEMEEEAKLQAGMAEPADEMDDPDGQDPPMPTMKAKNETKQPKAEKVKMEKAEPLSLPKGESLALSPLFASHMVVPAGVDFTIWGVAEEGSGPVEVTMGGETVSAELKEGGEWSVTMQAMDASRDPTSIQIKSTKASIQLEDILIGDVYLCIGAGNIDYQLQASLDGDKALKAAETEGLGEHLRIMSVEKKPCCATPQANFTARAEWQRVWSEGPTAEFSALCYYFGVEQVHRRPDTPVGLIQASATDSGSWQWGAPEIVKNCEKPEDVSDDVISIYWNSMLRPLTALRGVRAFIVEMEGDGCALLGTLQMMQSIWRTGKQGGSDIEVPAILSSQFSCTSPADLMAVNYDFQQAFLKIPRASIAVTADLCRPDSPGCGHHPPDKLEEARRFAIRAESVVHHNSSVPKSFPRPVDVYVDPYNESWGTYHFGAIGAPLCPPCVWGMRIVFDQDVEYLEAFKNFKGYMGHINGFQIYPNTSPGLGYWPVTPQFSWIGGNTVQLNMTIKVGELGGVAHPFPGTLQYGEGPFPILPILGAALGEPAAQFSIQVPMGKGKKAFKAWQAWEQAKLDMEEQAAA